MSVNKAIIIGRLGKAPELRFTQSGKAVASFSVATDSTWKDKSGEQQKQTEWHKIVVWGSQAEACAKYLDKGRECFIEGEIRTRSYDDKEGVKRYITEIVAQRVQFIGGKGRAETGEGHGEPEDAGAADVDGSEISF